MRFSGAVQNLSGTIGQPAVEIVPPPGKTIRVVRIHVTLTTALFPAWEIGRSTAPGVPSTTTRGESYQGRLASNTLLATAWSQLPTIPTIFLGWVFVPVAVGASQVYLPAQPVEVGSSLVIWNANGTPTASGFSIEWDED